MTALRLTPGDHARHLIDEAIETHGAMRVFWASALALLRARPRRRARPPDVGLLSEHMRRDIGFYPLAEAPREYIHHML